MAYIKREFEMSQSARRRKLKTNNVSLLKDNLVSKRWFLTALSQCISGFLSTTEFGGVVLVEKSLSLLNFFSVPAVLKAQ